MIQYNTINTKHGMAIVADMQTELESIAKQVHGNVFLFSRRDGEESYSERGLITLPYNFGVHFSADDMKYRAEDQPIIISDLIGYRWVLESENDLIRNAADEDHEPELISENADIVKEIETFEGDDFMFFRLIDGKQFYDVFRKEQTRWHDADVTEYQLAVLPFEGAR